MKKIYLLLVVVGFAFQGMAQTFVSTEVQNRNAVLTEFTGVNCTWCPDGHKVANEIAEDIPGTVLINVHSGSFATPSATQPDWTISIGEDWDDDAGSFGYPYGLWNRDEGSSNRSEWEGIAEDISDEESPVNIAVRPTLDVEKRELLIEVEIYYTDDQDEDENYLTVAILQNNIVGPQVGMEKYPEAILPNGMYLHQHMLRAVPTGKKNEEITSTTMGSFHEFSYTYKIPEDIKDVDVAMHNLQVAAFITEDDEPIITGVTEKVAFPENMKADLSVEDNTDLSAIDYCTTGITPTMEVTNEGPNVITSFSVNAQLGGADYKETFSGSLGVGESTTLEWDEIFLTGGRFTLVLNGPEDINGGDLVDVDITNSAGASVTANSFVADAIKGNFTAGFDGFYPAHAGIDWSLNGAGNVYYGVGRGANNTSGAIYLWTDARYGGAGVPADVILGKVDLSQYDIPSVSYYYAYASGNRGTNPNIDVEVSDDCGTSWSHVDGINASETGTEPASGAYIPTTAQYNYRSVSLADFKDKEVLVRIRMTPGSDGHILWMDEISIGDGLVSVDELSSETFSTYPNPFSENINVSLNVTEDTEVAINVYDALGRVVESVVATNYAAGAHNVTVNTTSLENGFYIVKLENNNKVLSQEVMIKK